MSSIPGAADVTTYRVVAGSPTVIVEPSRVFAAGIGSPSARPAPSSAVTRTLTALSNCRRTSVPVTGSINVGAAAPIGECRAGVVPGHAGVRDARGRGEEQAFERRDRPSIERADHDRAEWIVDMHLDATWRSGGAVWPITASERGVSTITRPCLALSPAPRPLRTT